MQALAKKILTVLSVALIFSIYSTAQSPRLRQNLNKGWTFSFEEAKERRQRVDLPHTWNAVDTFDDEPGYRRGPSRYERELKLSPQLRGKRLFLYFEGVNQTAEVLVNDKSAGSHVGGYSAFVFEITDLIDFNKPNNILVKVDNTLLKDIPPLDADFNMYGGIYRDVWLIAAGQAHLKVTDFASPGVRIETPQVSEKSARVKISGTVVNSGELTKELEVVNSIFDRQRLITSVRSKIAVSPKSETSFEQQTGEIDRPKLWSPNSPNLYQVKTVIRDNGKVLDEVTNPLGFRWFRFDAAEGFFLNGQRLKLRGANKHQDYAGLGNAVPEKLQVRDLEIIKENGFNFLRLAHYPQSKAVIEAADRLGIMLWEEIPIVNLITISEGFNRNAETMLTEMIRQHRNHPSIIIWGYMNEVFLRSPKTEADIRESYRLAQNLEKICKREDPARATAIAFDGGNTDRYYASGLAEVTDVVGWNLYQGWYSGVFEDFGKFLDAQHKRLPNRPLIVSEYGANGDQRVHSLAPKRFDSSIEWQRMFHETYLPQIDARPFIAGSAIWNQFDFGAEYRGETIPHLNQKGMFTYDRRPKDISYYYKAHFSTEPMLHIATRDWPKRSGNSKQTITVYSNLPSVELFQNGVTLGKQTVDENRRAVWEISLKAGNNSFVAVGAAGKKRLRDPVAIFYASPIDFSQIAVNVGSNTEFIDKCGTIWQADQPYRPGKWGYTGADETKTAETLRNILDSPDDPLFQTMREGPSSYKFDVPAGTYEIELCLTEIKFKDEDKRVFDIFVNGEKRIENLDLIKKSGMFRALTERFRVTVATNDGIELGFQARKDQPVLSGIRITKVR